MFTNPPKPTSSESDLLLDVPATTSTASTLDPIKTETAVSVSPLPALPPR